MYLQTKYLPKRPVLFVFFCFKLNIYVRDFLKSSVFCMEMSWRCESVYSTISERIIVTGTVLEN